MTHVRTCAISSSVGACRCWGLVAAWLASAACGGESGVRGEGGEPLDASSSPSLDTDADAGADAEVSPPIVLDPESRDTQDLPLELTFEPDNCPILDVEIQFIEEEYVSTGGVLVKALQLPAFTIANQVNFSDMKYWTEVPPENWDRSEFPEGACVVRLRGVVASCYENPSSSFDHPAGTDLFPDQEVGVDSYYQLLSRNAIAEAVPGCPRAEWGGGEGHWWYLSPRADDTLLIGCAPACAATMRWGGQLTLRPDVLR